LDELPRAIQDLIKAQIEEIKKTSNKDLTPKRIIESYLMKNNEVDNAYLKEIQRYLKKQLLENNISEVPFTQSITDYFTLKEIKEDIDFIIDKYFKNKYADSERKNVYFGTLENNENLATWIKVVRDSNEYLIISNRMLWDFIGKITCLIALSVDYENNFYLSYKFNDKKIYYNFELFKKIYMEIFLKENVIYNMPEIKRDSNVEYLYMLLNRAVKVFLFGHEYAHFLSGHFNEKKNVGYKNWMNEFQADNLGFDLCVLSISDKFVRSMISENDSAEVKNSLIRSGAILGMLGCLIIFECLRYIDIVNGQIYTINSSHPPIASRILAIIDIIRLKSPNEETFEFIYSKIVPIMRCIDLFFVNLIDYLPCLDIKKQLECNFQNIVFEQIIFGRSIDAIIRCLKSLNKKLICETDKVVENHDNLMFIESMYNSTKNAINMRQLTIDECHNMIGRCIEVLEKIPQYTIK
jgi:hypothetical protein